MTVAQERGIDVEKETETDDERRGEERRARRDASGRGRWGRGSCRGRGLLVLASCGRGAPPRHPRQRLRAEEDAEAPAAEEAAEAAGAEEARAEILRTIFPGRRGGGCRGRGGRARPGRLSAPEERAAKRAEGRKRKAESRRKERAAAKAGKTRRHGDARGRARVRRGQDAAGDRRLQQGREVDHRADRHRPPAPDLREGRAPLAHAARPRRAQRGRRGRHRAHRRDPAAVEDQALAPGRGSGEGAK